MKIIITQFEGTPEEYAKAQPLLNKTGAPPDHAEPTSTASRSDANGELSAAVIVKALTRRPMSKHQRKVLESILKAGDAGIYISDLAAKVGITRSELSGVLGATGRRETNTPGWPENLRMANYEWDGDKKERRYWLHPLVREVLLSGRVKL